MNIAMALNSFDVSTSLLSAVGRDAEGAELLQAASTMGLMTDYVYLSDDLPTDQYMAVEGANGLIAAIADAHSLEAIGEKIFLPLEDGRLADQNNPWNSIAVIDGNLTTEMLRIVANGNMFDQAELRIAPASPGKAERLQVFLGHDKATVYLNLEEANILTQGQFESTRKAGLALAERGLKRVLVTNGPFDACVVSGGHVTSAKPPEVLSTRVTGAGDKFMAAHIAAELRGEEEEVALNSALRSAADYVSSEKPL